MECKRWFKKKQQALWFLLLAALLPPVKPWGGRYECGYGTDCAGGRDYGVTGGLGLMGFLLLLILSRVKRVRIFIQVDKE